ncbi:olfactory receptor 1M1-like [Aquarana catesbeiana]|uniref:olfactory receptor 1M1-like n=1 Tax=Aquarana catesbeiana TaxID=8400 RepID=UPI003CC9BF1E
MHEKNMTGITMIHILGFQFSQNINIVAFFLFLVNYFMTICGNFLIITLVSYSKSLHSPMYFFLSQLAVSDILLITDILPNMLHMNLVKETKVSFSDCITQYYFFAVLEVLDSLLLTVMSYDRYLAICKPLHYNLIMNHQLSWIMVVTCWVVSFLVALIHTITISKLQFCGPYVIDHFFCDLDPILGLACGDTSIVQLEILYLVIIVAVIPFFIIIISYAYIIFTIYKIPSITGRQKVFSTCSSHLIVVSVYYVTLMSVYMVPSKGESWNMTKFFSLLYTVLTPLLNPIIYSLRNKELKNVFGRLINNFPKFQ